MRSCSSSTVLLRDHPRQLLSDSVTVWEQLPLTERLEIAESLIERGERFVAGLAVVVLFFHKDGSLKDPYSEQVAGLINRALGHLPQPTKNSWWRHGHVPILLGVAVFCLVVNSRL